MTTLGKNKNFESFFTIKGFALLLGFFTIAFWSYTFSFEFLNFDDNTFITQNKVIADTNTPISELLQYKLGQRDYFPVSFIFWRVLNEIFGFNAFVFHLSNVILHAANVVLVFFFCIRIFGTIALTDKRKKWLASLVALAFSIHPLHVESVAWVIDLKDMLFTFFYLSGMLLYFKWLTSHKKSFYWLSLLSGTLSIFSKSMGITFIGALLLIDLLNKPQSRISKLKHYLPFLIITAAGFWLFGMLGNPFGLFEETLAPKQAANPFYPSTIDQFPQIIKVLFIAAFRVFFWIKQFVLATSQTVFYPRTFLLNQYKNLLPLLPFLGIIVLSALVWFQRKNKIALAGASFFLISISPALIQTDYTLATFVPDRYMYLPILGLLLLLVSFLNKLKVKAAFSVAVVILLIWGSISVHYMPVWKNSEKLYNQALKIDENNVEPRLNRASYYLANEQDEKGLADLQILIDRYPKLEKPYYNRAVYYFLKKDYEKAIPDLDKVLSIDTLHFEGLVNRGIAHLRLKQLYEAHSDFSKAYDIDSNHFVLNKNIASMYNKAENHNTALIFAQKALETNPDDTDLLRIKGVALYFGLQFNQAIETFDRVIALKDEYDEVWYFRSKSLYETGQFEEAKKSVDKAIEKGYEAELLYLDILGKKLEKTK